MIDTIQREDVRELMTLEGQCVSIYIPTSAVGRERMAGPVRLKNQIERAHEMLVGQGMRSTLAWDLLAPLSKIVGDEKFWLHLSNGLAFLILGDQIRTLHVRQEVPELTVVGSHFHIRPLIACVDEEEAFILALDGKETRLIKMKGDRAEEVEVPDMPHSIEEALGSEYSEKQRISHSVGPKGFGGSISHGAGDRGAEVKDRDLRFCQAVDAVLTKQFGSAKIPLILAADEPILSIYRRHSHYPDILPQVVEGNPRRVSPRDLAHMALPILDQRRRQNEEHLMERFTEARPSRTSEDSLERILHLAEEGRVEVLFTDPNRVQWGVLGDDGRPILSTEQTLGAEDMINRAAIATLKGRGLVVESAPVEAGEIGAVALLRY